MYVVLFCSLAQICIKRCVLPTCSSVQMFTPSWCCGPESLTVSSEAFPWPRSLRALWMLPRSESSVCIWPLSSISETRLSLEYSKHFLSDPGWIAVQPWNSGSDLHGTWGWAAGRLQPWEGMVGGKGWGRWGPSWVVLTSFPLPGPSAFL